MGCRRSIPTTAARGLSRPLGLLALLLATAGGLPAQEQAAPAARSDLRVIAMPRIDSLEPTSWEGQGSTIDDDLLKTWKQKVALAREQGASVIVFEITSPGGYLQTAEQFVREIRALREEGVRVVAYVPQQALSAGAMLALACERIYMSDEARLGNIIPIKLVRGFEKAPEKVNSVRQTIERAAPPSFDKLYLRAMVDHRVELVRVFDRRNTLTRHILSGDEFRERYPTLESRQGVRHEVVVSDNEALVLDVDLAAEMKISSISLCTGRDDLPRVLGLGERPLAEGEVMELPRASGFSLRGLRLPPLATLLLVAGLIFLVLAVKTPGLGLFELLTVVSFAGYFLWSGASADILALSLGLLLIGFLFIALEVFFFPGVGIPAILGLVSVLLALYVGSIDLGGGDPEGQTLKERLIPDQPEEWQNFGNWWVTLLGSVVGGTWLALLGSRYLHHVPFLSQVFLSPPVLAAPGAGGIGTLRPSSYGAPVRLEKGMSGTAETDLRPSGRVRIDGGSISALSEGSFIRKGRDVRVVRVEGNRVYVTERAPGSDA